MSRVSDIMIANEKVKKLTKSRTTESNLIKGKKVTKLSFLTRLKKFFNIINK